MNPEIIDSLSVAGDRAKVNDDAFGCAGNRLWVLDGATGLGGHFLPGSSDAAWLARTANRLLHAHHAIRDTDQLVGVVIAGLASAFEAEQTHRPQERWELPIASLLVLTFSDDAIEAAWLGDCRAILEIGGFIVTCGETPGGEAQERAFAARIGHDLGATAMLRSPDVIEQLRIARAASNTGRGRWVLGLEPEAAKHLETAAFPRSGPVSGLAMSDGFSALELKYKRYTADGLLRQARTAGLAALATELRHIEEVEDPSGSIFPRFKVSDDATGVLFRAASMG
jgi:Protein phosphatase 2C